LSTVFSKFCKIYFNSTRLLFIFPAVIKKKTNAGAARPLGSYDSSGLNASSIQFSFLARNRTRQEHPLPVIS